MADVLKLARSEMVEFGAVQFIEDDELLEELGVEDARTLSAIVGVKNPAYPLDDLCASAEIAEVYGPWSLPDDFWLPRRLQVEYDSGRAANVHMRLPVFAHVMPALVPTAYIHNRTIHPVDGLFGTEVQPLSARRWGWEDVTAFTCYYIARPTTPPDASATLGCPEDALLYLARFVAEKLAIRARVEEVPLRIIQGRATSARKALLQLVEDYGTTDV